MPTAAELAELADPEKCSWTWYGENNTEFGGVPGWKVVSLVPGHEGKYIFLTGGFRKGTNLINNPAHGDYGGYYWSSQNLANPKDWADMLFVNKSCTAEMSTESRYYGCSIRPVIKAGKNFKDGHEYVDLGLGVKWATCNLGANRPEEFGDYYAWGETRPYYKDGHAYDSPMAATNFRVGKTSGYCWDSYFDSNADGTVFSKYYNGDGKTVLDLEADAAHVNWGGDWRMPTQDELYELLSLENCTWTWQTADSTEFGGTLGWKVKSKKNGNSIFLPAAGYRFLKDLNYVGSCGYYWSSSLYSSSSNGAIHLKSESGHYYNNNKDRSFGMSIRPVCE